MARPFEGLAGEGDIVALREFVPGRHRSRSRCSDSDRTVLLCSLLPGASPAMVRADGTIWLGLQVQHSYGDPSRDLAAVLTKALDAEPNTVVGLTEAPGEGPRLQDLLTDAPLEVTVHEGFDYWVADLEDTDGSVASALEQANGAAAPTVASPAWTRRTGPPWATASTSAGCCRTTRTASWTRSPACTPRQAERLVEGDRMIGMFRSHGVVAPVWDLPVGTGAEALEAPLAALATALHAAIDDDSALTSEERAARAGLTSRQLTIR